MALIALGVTGGIGAYKAVEVCRGLQKRGHDVVAVMTRVGGAVRRAGDVRGDHAASGHHVAVAAGHERRHRAHRDRRWHRLLLVAPCTANVIGKFANGIADDFLTSLYLATQGAGAAGAGDEHRTCWRTRPCSGICRRWPRAACGSSSRARAIWRAAGSGRAGWPSRRRSSRRRCAMRRAARLVAARPPCARHRGADLRRHRSGALRRQPVERPHGLRAGRRSAPARRAR